MVIQGVDKRTHIVFVKNFNHPINHLFTQAGNVCKLVKEQIVGKFIIYEYCTTFKMGYFTPNCCKSKIIFFYFINHTDKPNTPMIFSKSCKLMLSLCRTSVQILLIISMAFGESK